MKEFMNRDIQKNLDKWISHKYNILFVTGLSGSGKSTLAEEYEKKYHAHMIELDGIQHDYDSSGKDILAKCKDMPAFKYLREYYASDNPTHEFTKKEADAFRAVIKKIISICRADTKTLYIIEGIQLYELFDANFFSGKPLIIKGTSMAKSVIRGHKRDFTDKDGSLDTKGFIVSLPQRVKYTLDDNSQLRNFKKGLEEAQLLRDLKFAAESVDHSKDFTLV